MAEHQLERDAISHHLALGAGGAVDRPDGAWQAKGIASRCTRFSCAVGVESTAVAFGRRPWRRLRYRASGLRGLASSRSRPDPEIASVRAGMTVGRDTRALWADGPWSAAAFVGVATAVWIVVAASAAWLSASRWLLRAQWAFFPGRPWFGGWVRFDGDWYGLIALHGYSYRPGHRSAIAFFPAYPLLMRAIGAITGNVYLAGIVITVGCGLAAAVFFERWAAELIGRNAARTGLVLLLVYPYAFYLYGAVYSDALFLAVAIGAFLLVEHDHPVAAGLLGIVATAGRPVGAVLVLGLVVRVLERRGRDDVSAGIRSLPFGPVAGVLLALAGLGAWSGYLWQRFGDPFAFVAVERGWGQEPGLRTWFKAQFFDDLGKIHDVPHTLLYLAHPMAMLLALALVPLVWRRLGKGYGVYTATVLLVPAISTSNFWSMGRYALAAFPCFAVAGELLARRRVRVPTFIVSAMLLLGLSSLYARGVYVA